MRHKILSFFLVLFPFCSAYAQFSTPSVGIPHSPTKPKFIEVYGHRGARSYSPENTIPGYRTSLKVGVNWVDVDIVITKDRKILVSHDLLLNPNLVQENGHFITIPSPIFQFTAAELQKYDVGQINKESAYAKYFPYQVPVKGTKMPLFEEVISYVDKNSNKKVNFQLEIKTDPEKPDLSVSPEEYAQLLYALLKQKQIIERVEVQAFDWRYLYALQKLDKRIKTAYLVDYPDFEERMESNDLAYAGLWTGGKLVKDYDNNIFKMIKDLGGCCFEPEDATLTKEQLDEAHKFGLKVVVWNWTEEVGTAFDPVLLAKLIDWGVDGIITDDPGRLNSMLTARGYPVPKNYPAK